MQGELLLFAAKVSVNRIAQGNHREHGADGHELRAGVGWPGALEQQGGIRMAIVGNELLGSCRGAAR